jgi:hypothetical protein
MKLNSSKPSQYGNLYVEDTAYREIIALYIDTKN